MRTDAVLTTHADNSLLLRHHSAHVATVAAATCGSQLTARTFASVPAKQLWRTMNAVCFDVDSTVCEDEGIDVLAEHCGAGAAVKEWTHRCACV